MLRAIKTLLLLTICLPAYAAEPVATFGDWKVFSLPSAGKKYCYAYTTPFRTKAFDAERQNPYMIVSYKGPKMYSIGINSGYLLNSYKGFTMATNNHTYLLDLKLLTNAWTYSSKQDVAIIDDLLSSNDYIEVRSYDSTDKTALDYYSTSGLLTVIQYFEKHCQS